MLVNMVQTERKNHSAIWFTRCEHIEFDVHKNAANDFQKSIEMMKRGCVCVMCSSAAAACIK